MQTKTQNEKAGFGSKLGFILAAAGSAVGLGKHLAFSVPGGKIRRRNVSAGLSDFCGHFWLCLNDHRNCHRAAYREKRYTGVFRYEPAF